MTAINIKGRYTLREIDGKYYTYDREINGIREGAIGINSYEIAKLHVDILNKGGILRTQGA